MKDNGRRFREIGSVTVAIDVLVETQCSVKRHFILGCKTTVDGANIGHATNGCGGGLQAFQRLMYDLEMPPTPRHGHIDGRVVNSTNRFHVRTSDVSKHRHAVIRH